MTLPHTATVPAAGSKSDQRRASSSERRSPVATSSVIGSEITLLADL
jgi:hypothetical protein